MPLWCIYHPATTFQSEEVKAAVAKEITAVYTAANLPAFYVNVLFIPIAPSSIYIGGVARPSTPSPNNPPGPKSTTPFIRITIQNIARKLSSKEHSDRFLARVDKALKPFVADMGYDWEYSVTETSRDLWKVQGLVPPMPGSEAEREWATSNQAAPYEAAKGGLVVME